jgi:NAD(P)-dependent dehydrogenase (short-subunit alcohol dehydrogenase family)
MTTPDFDIPVGKGDRLAGKVAIITGAGSVGEGLGNGRASAITLARKGARVALLDVNEASAAETARLVEADGGQALVIRADVTVEADCRDAVRRTVERFGRLDILLNNVGIVRVAGDATRVDLAGWQRGFEVNVTAMMLMARFAVPEMKRCGGGSIINMASLAGLVGGHATLMYPATKGAVVNMTRAMAWHHGPDQIRVNCICPGFVAASAVLTGSDGDAIREARRNAGALKTEGTPWDVAHGVLFLASDESRWISGVVLPIDGGAYAVTPHFANASPSSRL